jgi:hypothetical protein
MSIIVIGLSLINYMTHESLRHNFSCSFYSSDPLLILFRSGDFSIDFRYSYETLCIEFAEMKKKM